MGTVPGRNTPSHALGTPGHALGLPGRSTPHALVLDKRDKVWREQQERREQDLRREQETSLRRDQELRREQEASLARHFQAQRAGMDSRNPLLPPTSMPGIHPPFYSLLPISMPGGLFMLLYFTKTGFGPILLSECTSTRCN